MQIVRLDVNNLQWHVRPRATGGGYVASCGLLGQAVEGDTHGEVVGMIQAVMTELFRDLLADGELAAFLREHGWRAISPIPQSSDDVHFDVPYDVIRDFGAHSA